MSSSQLDSGAGPSRSRSTKKVSVDDAQIDPSLMQNLVHLPDVPPSASSNTQPNPVIRTDLSHRDIQNALLFRRARRQLIERLPNVPLDQRIKLRDALGISNWPLHLDSYPASLIPRQDTDEWSPEDIMALILIRSTCPIPLPVITKVFFQYRRRISGVEKIWETIMQYQTDWNEMDDDLLYVRIAIDNFTFRRVLETTGWSCSERDLRVIYAQLIERRRRREMQLRENHRQREMQLQIDRQSDAQRLKEHHRAAIRLLPHIINDERDGIYNMLNSVGWPLRFRSLDSVRSERRNDIGPWAQEDAMALEIILRRTNKNFVFSAADAALALSPDREVEDVVQKGEETKASWQAA
jgi:hypothetical protein